MVKIVAGEAAVKRRVIASLITPNFNKHIGKFQKYPPELRKLKGTRKQGTSRHRLPTEDAAVSTT